MWECYLRSKPKKNAWYLEAGGNERSEGTATMWPEETDRGETLVRWTRDGDNQAEEWRTEHQGYRSGTSSPNINWRRVHWIVWNRKRLQNIMEIGVRCKVLDWIGLESTPEKQSVEDNSIKAAESDRINEVGEITGEESAWWTASYNI